MTPSFRHRAALPLVALCLLALASGCMSARHPVRLITALRPPDQDAVFSHLVRADGGPPTDKWDFSPPHRLRPCCAFGSGLSVRVGYLPIAGLRIDNIVAADALGHHRYNSGLISLQNEPSNAFISPENNGLVYTCRGGFIDTAHVRDYADWMVYLAGRVGTMLESGGTIELPEEGGRRYVHVAPVSADLIEKAGKEELSIRIAQWASIQLAIWHETATWYGWSSWGMFPETASAFSPEDLYSNLVGSMLATNLIRADLASNEAEYNRSMDAAMPEVLRRLGAASRNLTRKAMRSVDGLWWDSSRPLPDKEVVLRRSFQIGPEIRPWSLPYSLSSGDAEDVEGFCDSQYARLLPLRYPTRVSRVPLRELVRLDVEVSRPLAARLAVDRPEGPWLSQDDFPVIVGRARLENSEEFGSDADSP